MLSSLKEHFFWKYAFNEDGIFARNINKAYSVIQSAIKYTYVYFMVLVFLQLSNITDYQNLEMINPIWPMLPFQGVSPVMLVIIIQIIELLTLIFLFFNPYKRRVRILFFVAFFFSIALDNSFGKIDHGLYLPLLLAFFMALMPDQNEGSRKAKSVLMFATTQFFLLMTYSLTGFWKLFWGVIEFFTKDVSLFSPLSFRNTIIYQFELTEATLLGNWFIEHYYFGYILYLLVIYIELFSILIFFKANLHKIWGILLIYTHIGIELILGVNFYPNIFVLGILLVFSPFHHINNFKSVVLALPVISTVNSIVKKRKV